MKVLQGQINDLKLVPVSVWRCEAGRCSAGAEVGKRAAPCSGRGGWGGEEGKRLVRSGWAREQGVMMDFPPHQPPSGRAVVGVAGTQKAELVRMES